MFKALYEMIMYTLLDFNNIDLSPKIMILIEQYALAITFIIFTIMLVLLFKIWVYMLTFFGKIL